MARFLLRRLVQFPLILAIIYLTTFTLVWLAPGDPFAMLNERNNPEAAEQLRKQFNADSPWRFLATYPVKLLSGEMGPSFKYQGVQVGDIICTDRTNFIGKPVSLEKLKVGTELHCDIVTSIKSENGKPAFAETIGGNVRHTVR